MRGIQLKRVVKLFGFKVGFSFWFKWSFVDPIKMFIWLNITHKEYCTYSGFHCNKENCQHKHLFTKKEILQNWKETNKEMEKVEVGENGTCAYCGDEKGTIEIPNPNMSELNYWLVCKNCKEIIAIQQELAFLSLSKIDNPKRAEELNNRLLEISKQTKKPIMNIELNKEADGYKVSSVEFTGKKDTDDKVFKQ